MRLKAPFPYFGGKSRVASLVWQRFGDTRNYVEPFFGSGAVLLGRPHYNPDKVWVRTETVNDKDCFIANFWRALAADPDGVAKACDWPVNEADLHARHLWLCRQTDFVERMKTDPDYYDVKLAGWWVWGMSAWIGAAWCRQTPQKAIPDMSSRGVHRRMICMHSRGVQRAGLWGQPSGLPAYLSALAARLRRVRVCCGDWQRITGPTPTYYCGLTAVFLDPPYSVKDRADVYNHDSRDVAVAVREWCIANQDHPKLRIALCGYDGEHELPGWDCVAWKASGGYGNHGARGNANRHRERIWFSPRCLRPGRVQQVMFGDADNTSSDG